MAGDLSLIAEELAQVHREMHRLQRTLEAMCIVVTPEDVARMDALTVEGRRIVRRLRRLDAQN